MISSITSERSSLKTDFSNLKKLYEKDKSYWERNNLKLLNMISKMESNENKLYKKIWEYEEQINELNIEKKQSNDKINDLVEQL